MRLPFLIKTLLSKWIIISSKVDLMKQNNEEQLEPRTKSSFSNIFPVTSFDDHDSPEEQLQKLVQLGG